MHDAVQRLAERGNIQHFDARILICFCTQNEICRALSDASVWELRDMALQRLEAYLGARTLRADPPHGSYAPAFPSV